MGVAALLDVWGEKLGGPERGSEILACSRTGWGRHHHHHLVTRLATSQEQLGYRGQGSRVLVATDPCDVCGLALMP